ncbi:hypothetical protein [Mycobacterium lepromatosis]|uniref:hypothetical protein n=1 Tax=Mycobacterium lepromatosis TaxID=480418 RepID=UPI00067916A2|nr:hypothetical protein [Mycobacterium lepromatosis]
MTAVVARAGRFDRYGGLSLLYLADICMPAPRLGELVAESNTDGINPGAEASSVSAVHEIFPVEFAFSEGKRPCQRSNRRVA